MRQTLSSRDENCCVNCHTGQSWLLTRKMSPTSFFYKHSRPKCRQDRLSRAILVVLQTHKRMRTYLIAPLCLLNASSKFYVAWSMQLNLKWLAINRACYCLKKVWSPLWLSPAGSLPNALPFFSMLTHIFSANTVELQLTESTCDFGFKQIGQPMLIKASFVCMPELVILLWSKWLIDRLTF